MVCAYLLFCSATGDLNRPRPSRRSGRLPVTLNIAITEALPRKSPYVHHTTVHISQLISSEWTKTQEPLTGFAPAAPSFLRLIHGAWPGKPLYLLRLEVPFANSGPVLGNPIRQNVATVLSFFFPLDTPRLGCSRTAHGNETRHVPFPWTPGLSMCGGDLRALRGKHVSRQPF